MSKAPMTALERFQAAAAEIQGKWYTRANLERLEALLEGGEDGGYGGDESFSHRQWQAAYNLLEAMRAMGNALGEFRETVDP